MHGIGRISGKDHFELVLTSAFLLYHATITRFLRPRLLLPLEYHSLIFVNDCQASGILKLISS